MDDDRAVVCENGRKDGGRMNRFEPLYWALQMLGICCDGEICLGPLADCYNRRHTDMSRWYIGMNR